MRKNILITFLTCLILKSVNAQDQQIANLQDIERILSHLASDEMRGRHALTPDAERAADYIAQEFKEIGLSPYIGSDFKQTFKMNRIKNLSSNIIWDNTSLDKDLFLILGNNKRTTWNQSTKVQHLKIDKQDDFSSKFREIAQAEGNAIVLIDPSYAPYIKRFNSIYGKENIVSYSETESSTKVFIVKSEMAKKYEISHSNDVSTVSMSNVAGILPGKTKKHEYVVFSGHYDHIGIIAPQGQDSIANGADDDASGITAMISLAKYYKAQGTNERTLIFVAFTAEEIGMFGSKYFSNNINADSVIAMINIEMIGKDSKFGPNTLYITGYDRSNLGELMQSNLQGSAFRFYPDPYTKQNLFYRSDNAVLAALGVPAHTFSTSQIDKDEYYHTVKDEISTLDLENIRSSIEAIAIGAKGIVDGTQTPSRVEKLK